MSNMDFSEFLDVLKEDDFEEIPVSVEEFVNGEEFLDFANEGLVLSEYQYQLIKVSTQIYKKETLFEIYDHERAERRWKETKNEVIAQWGKGSGKDFASTIAVAYLVYLLLCLKDPAKYYGKPSGDNIDILNVAINADQARRVFFDNFKQRIFKCSWFAGKFSVNQGHFAFNKNINVYSGHSEREAFEGYNFLYVVLDEIAGFAIDNNTGNANAKTAEAIYDMYSQSVTSRFAEYGKIVLLSFPRYRDDFIQTRYKEAIKVKETVVQTHRFKIDRDLPDGIEGNEFDISWEQDHIIEYEDPRTFALKRASWEVNPGKDIDKDYTRAFLTKPTDSLGRFACMPPDAIDAFFKDKNKIQEALTATNFVEEDGSYNAYAKPDPNKVYFVHVDLARLHDNCAVAIAHVEKWGTRRIGTEMTEAAPVVRVDGIRWWKPTRERSVDFVEVREFILSLRTRGYNVRLVTFDRWESTEMIDYLNSMGQKAEKLSVAKKHYEDLAMVVHEGRLTAPAIELLEKELLQLRIMPNDKVDHPRNGSKDLADAMCGAVHSAIAHTKRNQEENVEVLTLAKFKEVHRNELEPVQPKMIIDPPKRDMPADLGDYLSRIGVI